jgi:hypothetical protein
VDKVQTQQEEPSAESSQEIAALEESASAEIEAAGPAVEAPDSAEPSQEITAPEEPASAEIKAAGPVAEAPDSVEPQLEEPATTGLAEEPPLS